MSYRVHVYLKSSSYSEEYAQEKHQGNDSAENARFEWEDEFRVNGEFTHITIVQDTSYILQGEMNNGTPFSYEIQNTNQFVLHEKDKQTLLVFSASCIDSFENDEKYQVLKVYLNDTEAIENPIPGVYLTYTDFPTELKS